MHFKLKMYNADEYNDCSSTLMPLACVKITAVNTTVVPTSSVQKSTQR